MNETEQTATTATASSAKENPLVIATTAAMGLRDGITAISSLVYDCWRDGVSADRARHAIDWLADKMDDDCDKLHEALDNITPPADAV